MADNIIFSRRDSLKSLLAISAAGALAACTGQAESGTDKPTSNASLKYASEGKFLSSSEMALLSAVAQTIIPKTDTGGAIEAGVPETIQELASDWGDDNHRKYWREGLAAIGDHFKKVGGQAFDKQSPKQREALLSKYDMSVYAGQTDDQFYRDLKSTVSRAYYMSEIGASEELAYEAVPGDFKGCVPLSDYPKTWAT